MRLPAAAIVALLMTGSASDVRASGPARSNGLSLTQRITVQGDSFSLCTAIASTGGEAFLPWGFRYWVFRQFHDGAGGHVYPSRPSIMPSMPPPPPPPLLPGDDRPDPQLVKLAPGVAEEVCADFAFSDFPPKTILIQSSYESWLPADTELAADTQRSIERGVGRPPYKGEILVSNWCILEVRDRSAYCD